MASITCLTRVNQKAPRGQLWANVEHGAPDYIRSVCSKIFLYDEYENLHIAKSIQAKLRVGDPIPEEIAGGKEVRNFDFFLLCLD